MSIQAQHPPPPPENRLLAGLLVHERNAVQRVSTIVGCAQGQTLLSANTQADFVFFPIDAVLAPVRRVGDRRGVDLALVGHEGMIGSDAFALRRKHSDDLMVRASGTAYCMPAEDFRHQFERRGGLHCAVLRFISAYMLQLGQNAACSRFHALDGRIARWLLMIHDRGGALEIDVASDELARCLGSEEKAVDHALDRLAVAKCIRHQRHSIRVTELEALEMRACDCYEELRQIYDQILPV